MSRYNLAWLIVVPMMMILGVSLSFTAPARQHDKEYKLVRTIVDILAEVVHRVELAREDHRAARRTRARGLGWSSGADGARNGDFQAGILTTA